MNATIDKFGVLPDFEILDIHQLAPPLIAAEDMDIDYVTGLIDGDGSITFSFPTSQRKVVSNIIVTASLDDLEVMNDLVVFFGCGKVYRLKKKAYIFYVSNASHILNKVWPLISLGQFNTVKKTYLGPSLEVLQILTNQGIKLDKDLLKIVDLVYNMNQGGKKRKLTKADYCKFFNLL